MEKVLELLNECLSLTKQLNKIVSDWKIRMEGWDG